MLASPPRRSTLTATLRSQTNHSRRVSLPDQRFILLISHVADPVKPVSCLPVAADPDLVTRPGDRIALLVQAPS